MRRTFFEPLLVQYFKQCRKNILTCLTLGSLKKIETTPRTTRNAWREDYLCSKQNPKNASVITRTYCFQWLWAVYDDDGFIRHNNNNNRYYCRCDLAPNYYVGIMTLVLLECLCVMSRWVQCKRFIRKCRRQDLYRHVTRWTCKL